MLLRGLLITATLCFLVAYQLNSWFIFTFMMLFLFNVRLRNKYDDDDDEGKVDHVPQQIVGGCSSPSSRPWAQRWRTTNVCDAWPVQCQTYGYFPSLRWYQINTAYWQLAQGYTEKRSGQKLNMLPVDCKSNALLLRHGA